MTVSHQKPTVTSSRRQEPKRPRPFFDVIISNPPYQFGRRQVYADFYKLAVNLNPDILCMVFPQGWQKPTNHNGLAGLNIPTYKQDPHLVSIDNYSAADARNFFPGLNIGSLNIVLRSRQHHNHGHIQQLTHGQPAGTITLPLSHSDVERPPELQALLPLVELHPKISSLGSARKPYGFHADPLRNPAKYGLHLQDSKQHPSDLRLYGLFADETRGYRYIPRADLPTHNQSATSTSNYLDHYKLFVPKAWGNMSSRIGLGGSFANICVASPGDVCAETFIEFGPFDTQSDAIKMAKYFLTQFFRACLMLEKTTQNTPRDKYSQVPLVPLTGKIWDKSIQDIDAYLFKKFHVPATTQDFIRTHLQPRTSANIEIL